MATNTFTYVSKPDVPEPCPTCCGQGGWKEYDAEENPFFDPCPDCLMNHKCPRCGALHLETWGGTFCYACHWGL